MKKITVQYFCDKCGCQLFTGSDHHYHDGVSIDHYYYGSMLHRFYVTIECEKYMGLQYEQAMLCGKCKIEALEEVLKELKARDKKISEKLKGTERWNKTIGR
jgi:ribosomal protein L44E